MTRLFLMENGDWTSEAALAFDFYLNNRVQGLELKLNEVEWFYVFVGSESPKYDFAIPMG